MAEFVDVLKMARRMCKSIDGCGDCPLLDASTELCYLDKYRKEYNDKDFIRHEAAIMKWAAENPEFRYPTWREWQKKNFPNAGGIMCPCSFIGTIDANCAVQSSCEKCSNHPIPADIAEKLGIKLKERADV